jgi:hypothetical protein
MHPDILSTPTSTPPSPEDVCESKNDSLYMSYLLIVEARKRYEIVLSQPFPVLILYPKPVRLWSGVTTLRLYRIVLW